MHGFAVSEFDYIAPAELYAAQGRGGLKYRRFPRAAEAIRYAIEKLPANLLAGSRLEVEEQHYDGKQIRDLYERYPLSEPHLSVTART
jgi:hypothetical protein